MIQVLNKYLIYKKGIDGCPGWFQKMYNVVGRSISQNYKLAQKTNIFDLPYLKIK